MRLPILLGSLLALMSAGAPAAAQMTLEEAREAGKALGNQTRRDETLVPMEEAQAAAVPGYSGTDLPQGSYFDDPERLEADAASARAANEQYRITTDAEGTRPAFSNSEILATTARGTSVETDPSTYLAGQSGDAANGSCTPLPQASGSQGFYEATCNANRASTENDCGSLEANGSCSFLRSECLDENPADGGCNLEERVYRCPTPEGHSEDRPQYICGDDVYCINGDCEPIVREASTEFKDALVALHSIDQAGKEFDETSFTVFSGERNTCHKPVFGLINCCAGKASGALSASAGAAALAGGPAAIAALATPFLTLFGCSQAEMQLDIKDRMGFCHKVGTWCSSSVLGVCKTKRTAYCCFESKLSRILQEQGRVQLGKPWGKPKKEQCAGFTIEEFSRLDLSVMDFTEVYAEFMDAAKLPDEVETLTQIQQKIEDYYDLHAQ